jgi:thymidylate kinase
MANALSIVTRPTKANLDALAARAGEVHARLSNLHTPLIVEFSGSPKSGKSTNIDIVHHFFKRLGFNVWAPTEGASKRTPYTLRRDLVAFNSWSLNYAISELLLSYHNVDKPHLVILDRGPFDSLAWMGVLKDQGNLDEEEYTIIKSFALHPKWAKLVDRVYLFTCSPQNSLSRETAFKLTVKSGIAMNRDMLKRLLKKYTAFAAELDAHPVRTVNTDNETHGAKNSSYAIARDLLDCFSKKLEMSV